MESPKHSLDIALHEIQNCDPSVEQLGSPSTSGSSNWRRTFPTEDSDVPITAVALPPVDSGFHAYAYLASAFTFELLVWSLPFSYGVFLNYYTTVLFKHGDSQLHLLPLVGTLSSGIIYIASLLVLPLVLRYPAHKRNVSIVGLLVCMVGLVGAGFATRPIHLVLTQGIIYSIGATLLFFPILTCLPEWFSVKRGLANGILFSGTGLGGVIVPFLVEDLLNRHGHRKAFIIIACMFAGLACPSFLFAKPRLPPTQARASNDLDLSFMKNQAFWLFIIANIIQAFANFLPGIYLPSFANDLKLSTTSGTLALSLMNAFSVPGLILIGGMSDRFDLRLSIFMSTIGSALAILVVWGFATRLAPLLVFACLYGFFSGGFSVLWPKFIGVISKDDPHLYSTLMSLFISSRGLGNVLSGPLSTALLEHSPMYDVAKFGYGLKGYGPLILFSGCGMLFSTIAATYPYFAHKTIEINITFGTTTRETVE
ncbi:hypothetical protein FRB94_000825 [Tulasnella sp. JGI-2019a]|nr:hypothetical protein FRB94_000825 [Tulasnella sp. JGI-2019a]KAG9014513.1 hypothetical protein FRB93_013638 [Tulasnella sp. JGI-2019a]